MSLGTIFSPCPSAPQPQVLIERQHLNKSSALDHGFGSNEELSGNVSTSLNEGAPNLHDEAARMTIPTTEQVQFQILLKKLSYLWPDCPPFTSGALEARAKRSGHNVDPRQRTGINKSVCVDADYME